MTRVSRSHTARLLGVSVITLRAWADAGVGPQPNRLGRYDRATLLEWAQEMSAGCSYDGPVLIGTIRPAETRSIEVEAHSLAEAQQLLEAQITVRRA